MLRRAEDDRKLGKPISSTTCFDLQGQSGSRIFPVMVANDDNAFSCFQARTRPESSRNYRLMAGWRLEQEWTLAWGVLKNPNVHHLNAHGIHRTISAAWNIDLMGCLAVGPAGFAYTLAAGHAIMSAGSNTTAHEANEACLRIPAPIRVINWIICKDRVA